MPSPPSPTPINTPLERALRRYRGILPQNEAAALGAWLSTFYDFQLDWVLEEEEQAVCNKSRQIGISHASSAVSVIWGAYHGELTTVISKGQLESDEVLDKAKKHAYVLQSLGSTMAETLTSNTEEVVFASGGRIIALPASGGRGFTGNVVLDEFAYQEHATKVWDAAAAVTLLGDGKLRVLSSPNGEGNEFANLVAQAKKPGSGIAYHEIPLQKALDQGYPVNLKKAWKLARNDPRLFDQFFNCSFLDGNLQYVPTAYVDACRFDDLTAEQGDYYAGLDIGRNNDLTVLIILRYWKKIRTVVSVQFMKRTDYAGLDKMVSGAFEHYKLRRLCIDETGLGTTPAELIKKKHSERIDIPSRRPRVEPIWFTNDKLDELATGLFTACAEKTIRLPKTDAALPGCPAGTADALRKAIISIRRIVSKSNNVTYDAPRTSEGHADHAWSLALALHACSSVNAMVEALTG